MSRTFWLAVGAVGGIVAYRKSTQAAARARELGALGTAQAAADATSRLAGRTAHGLGRLNDIRDRRQGRLVLGSAEEVGSPARPGSTAAGATVPTRSAAGAGDEHTTARASRTAARRSSPTSGGGSGGMSRGPEVTARDGA